MRMFKKGIVALLLIISIVCIFASSASAASYVSFNKGYGSLALSGTTFSASTGPQGSPKGYTCTVSNVKLNYSDYAGVPRSDTLPANTKVRAVAKTTKTGVYTVRAGTSAYHSILADGVAYSGSTWW